MSTDTVSAGIGTGKAVVHSSLGAVTEYLLPLGSGIVGFFSARAAGGYASIWKAIYVATSGNSQLSQDTTWINRVAALVMMAIWGSIGMAFWHLGRGEGMIRKAVGRGLGAFFFGMALGWIPQLVSPGATPDGFLDGLIPHSG